MKISLQRLFAAFCFAAAAHLSPVFSQTITITFPTDRAVFQRSNANEAVVWIGGYVTQPYQTIEARLIPRVAGEGAPAPAGGGWQAIDTQLECGQFYGSLTAKGGWYQLEVRGTLPGAAPQVASLAHVGVGEVFVVAGQSNATGGDANPNGAAAKYDQVNSVNFQNVDAVTQSIAPYNAAQLPCPAFVHLDAAVKTAPFGNYAWCWGTFGDRLYEKLHVPVMIFNAGWSSTGIANWQKSVHPDSVTTSAFGYVFPAGMPFGHLRLALQNYVSQLGIRAILWHQGETDNYIEQPGDNTLTRYAQQLWEVISATRTLTGKPNLAWLVSRASRFTVNGASRVSAQVIGAQNQIVNKDNLYPQVYPGPETDPFYDINYRSDEIHFRGDGVTPSADGKIYSGLNFLAKLWADQITPAFLTQSIPYAAGTPPLIHAVPAANAQTIFSATGAPGIQYVWLDENNCNGHVAAGQQWTAGGGSYKLKMTDTKGNVVFSPVVHVSGNALPVTWEYFTATENAHRVSLEWATASESDASYFEIERSEDAVHFDRAGTHWAWGNAAMSHHYAFTDEPQKAGTYYYRLKEWDADNTFTYSMIRRVDIGIEDILIYPNPAGAYLFIDSKSGLPAFQILDVHGNVIDTKPLKAGRTTLHLEDLQDGLYFIRTGEKVWKFLKKE